MGKLLAALAVGVVSCGAAASPNAPIHLVSAPRTITLGQTWTATLQSNAGRPFVIARHAGSVTRARSTAVAKQRYRVRLRLGAVGSWQVSASLAGRSYRLASVSVRAAPAYALDNPAQLVEAGEGALLVAERGTRNRILRVDPATGAFSVFASGIPSPWGLGFDTDGSVLVSSTSGLYRVADGKNATKVADVSISPFAVMKDGSVAFANETSVGIVTAGARPQLLPVTVNFAHGLALLGDGELAKTTFARGLSKPYALTRAHDGTVYVTEAGDVARASGALRRVAPDGTVTTIRLIKR